jgi:hypothetical protein
VTATTFTVNSATQVTATVPSGTKTGKITITTPGGTANSTGTFTVPVAAHCAYVCPSIRCPELTGSCVGIVGGACRSSTDLVHCPRGQPARDPATECNTGVDLSRTCNVSTARDTLLGGQD